MNLGFWGGGGKKTIKVKKRILLLAGEYGTAKSKLCMTSKVIST
jgi:hypothetical protein